jgi:hypothetical protein
MDHARGRLRLLILLVVLAALGRSGVATALATAVAQPSSLTIALGRATPPPLILTWRTTGAGPVVSFGGRVFLDDAAQTTIQTLPPLPAQPTGVATYHETIQLRDRDLQRAVQAGVRRIVVVRNFKNGLDLVSGVAVVSITSGLGADFAVTRIQLRLGEGAPLRLVLRGEAVPVWADVSYGGNGELEAVWELAEPGSSAGELVYRPLRRLRRVLGAGQRVSLRAPDLPSDQTGLYLVRLRVVDPAPSFEEPVLRYYVAPEGETPPEPAGIVVLSPEHGAELDAETTFAWRALPGARAYRLELHRGDAVARRRYVQFDPEHPSYADAPGTSQRALPFETGELGPSEPRPLAPERGLLDGEPVAGILVPAGQSSVRLSAAALSRLRPGGTYLWVVRALGTGSVPIGLSPPRLVRYPEHPGTPGSEEGEITR